MEKANQKTVVRLARKIAKLKDKVKEMEYNIESIKMVTGPSHTHTGPSHTQGQVKYLSERIDNMRPASFLARIFARIFGG